MLPIMAIKVVFAALLIWSFMQAFKNRPFTFMHVILCSTVLFAPLSRPVEYALYQAGVVLLAFAFSLGLEKVLMRYKKSRQPEYKRDDYLPDKDAAKSPNSPPE